MAVHFGEMLLDRRRQMGMSIQQVANTIKIRPQIIEFFETENFAAMPPRGYAQGMISSYARFLGLNPREVVEAYFDALAVYESSSESGRAGAYQEDVTLASPRSSNATGRFLMVGAAPASSRYGQRPQQAGYVSESHSPHEPLSASDMRSAQNRGGRRLPPAASDPYAAPQRGYSTLQQQTLGAARSTRPRSGSGSQPTTRFPVQSGAPGSRGGRRQGGRPDPRYAGQARPGQRGAGYGPGRGNAPQGSHGGRGPQGNRSGRGRSTAPAGITIAGFTFDPRVLIGAVAGLLVIVLILVFLLVRGCSATPKSADASQDAPKTQAAAGSSDTGSDDDAASDEEDDTKADQDATADANAGTDKAATDPNAADAQPKETKVKVSLKGEDTVAWIEVKLDGKSVIAEQMVAPFEKEFTVTQSIEITTDKPSAVTITKNGEKVRYDTKASGVAKVTITVPQPDPADDASQSGADGADGTQTQDGAQAQDGTQSQDGTQTQDGAQAQPTQGAALQSTGQDQTTGQASDTSSQTDQ